MPHMPRARRPHGSHMAELRHLSALREAMAGAGAGRLPLHLLLSDRDFDENDYEALLALDESVESRKGQRPLANAHLAQDGAGQLVVLCCCTS